MIDYFFRFVDEAAAISQAPPGFYQPPQASGSDPSAGGWNFDKVLPNVKAWRPSQDLITQGTDPRDGETINIILHTYLSGWFAIVSIPNLNQQMLNHPQLQFALDRIAFHEGDPFLVKNNIGGIINDVACAPTFSGCDYPMGGYH